MNEPTVTTNPPAQSNAMGGAPTTTQDVSGPITLVLSPLCPVFSPRPPHTTARIANQPAAVVATQPPAVPSLHIFLMEYSRLSEGAIVLTRTDPRRANQLALRFRRLVVNSAKIFWLGLSRECLGEREHVILWTA